MVEYRQSPTGLKSAVVYRKPLNVGLVAKICQVSKKTVLNWIYRDALKAFTTYGGHYRVWPGDLREFIVRSGLDVPFNCVDERQTLFLIVDDDREFRSELKELLGDYEVVEAAGGAEPEEGQAGVVEGGTVELVRVVAVVSLLPERLHLEGVDALVVVHGAQVQADEAEGEGAGEGAEEETGEGLLRHLAGRP